MRKFKCRVYAIFMIHCYVDVKIINKKDITITV